MNYFCHTKCCRRKVDNDFTVQTSLKFVAAVGGPHLFVILPAIAIKMFPFPLAAAIFRPTLGNFLFEAAILGAAGAEKTKPLHEIFTGHHNLQWEGKTFRHGKT